VELMVKDGLLDEIRSILNSGIPEKATAMQAIGYKEFIDAMAGRSRLEEAIAQVQQSSRRYAKRQQTWFKRNEKIHWLLREKGQRAEEIFSAAFQLARNFDK
jgi:tRNA dimethylallyltransferase